MLQHSTWGATVGAAIALQWVVILTLSAFAWFWSAVAALSLLAGGAAVAVPNAVLALWLTVRGRPHGGAVALTMMVGEMLKLGFTLALLVMFAVKLRSEMSGLALIVGVLGALKAQWLALWVTRRY